MLCWKGLIQGSRSSAIRCSMIFCRLPAILPSFMYGQHIQKKTTYIASSVCQAGSAASQVLHLLCFVVIVRCRQVMTCIGFVSRALIKPSLSCVRLWTSSRALTSTLPWEPRSPKAACLWALPAQVCCRLPVTSCVSPATLPAL